MFLRVPGFCNPPCAWLVWILFLEPSKPGAIIGDGYRKSWGPRATMIWDNFATFGNKLRYPDDKYLLRSTHMSCVVAKIPLCWFFKAMEGNKSENKNQGAHVWFYALKLICSRSWTRKLLPCSNTKIFDVIFVGIITCERNIFCSLQIRIFSGREILVIHSNYCSKRVHFLKKCFIIAVMHTT